MIEVLVDRDSDKIDFDFCSRGLYYMKNSLCRENRDKRPKRSTKKKPNLAMHDPTPSRMGDSCLKHEYIKLTCAGAIGWLFTLFGI
jgi:hypothetical protein